MVGRPTPPRASASAQALARLGQREPRYPSNPPTLPSTRLAPYAQPTAAQGLQELREAWQSPRPGKRAGRCCRPPLPGRPTRLRRLRGREPPHKAAPRLSVVGPRAAAQEQQEPHALQVRKVRQVVQECLFADVVRVAEGHAQRTRARRTVCRARLRRARALQAVAPRGQHCTRASCRHWTRFRNALGRAKRRDQGPPGPPRTGDDIHAIQVCKQLLARLQFSRCPLEAIMLAQRKECGGQGIALFAPFRLAHVAVGPGCVPPAVNGRLPVEQTHER